MKRSITLVVLSVLLYACTPSANLDKSDDSGQKPSTPDVPVELSDAICEDFSGQLSSLLECNIRTIREDFRYFMSFPSISERDSRVMLLRIDPTDAAGIKRGPAISSVDKCSYGSYSARFRVPNTLKAQPDLGVCASIGLYDGDNAIIMEVRLSDPYAIYLLYADKEEIVRPASFNANSKFYEYGIDLYKDKIIWWLRSSKNMAKMVVKESDNSSFATPLDFSFNYYYSKLKPVENRPNSIQAPLYAYELELDEMNYTPFDDEK